MKDLKHLLDINYPIVQAPMLGVSTPAMVAAVADSGGLGALPLGGLSPEKTLALIRETKAKADKPFSVNLFAHSLEVELIEAHIAKMETFMEILHKKYNLPFKSQSISGCRFYNHLDQIDILLDEQVPIVSFTFGLPEAGVIEKFIQRGVKLIGTATSVEEAVLLENAGMDAIVAQGIEAGGHRGSFIVGEELPQTGLMALIPQVVDKVSIPIIAAGGIFDHRTIKAAFALGAVGVQLGSYFLAADESAAGEVYKEQALAATDTSTELTQAFTGKWARGIRNSFMQDIKNADLNIPHYPYQNSLTTALRDFGKLNGIADIISLWAGQSVSKSKRGSTENLFKELIKQMQVNPNPVF
ncbi:nitronate monooxygenase [Pedobacter petrophilus]|uniref:Nitronate monooxygenase n=2 Tax=Pedobacter TaxID=84567 RepID=A0A7K0G4E7_9SPHI|nr:nitronate monooxygenase [Pedobacter petrophilus]MRX78512.1 nitronate monooxygenase [Pedobacter petrophilus]